MTRFRPLMFGGWAVLSVTLLSVVVFWMLKPLHQAGWGQGLSSFLIGLDHVLQVPAGGVARGLGFHFGHHRQGSEWLVLVLINGPIYFALGFLAAFLWSLLFRPAKAVPAAANPPPPPRLSRRRFLRAAVGVAATGAGVGLGYSLVAEPRWFVITRRALPIRDLPPELDGLRLVQLTDIHHGPWLSLDYVRQVVDAANALQPDVVLLTGDFVSESSAYIQPVMNELGRLQSRIGNVAILGNHDWWEDGELTQQELTRIGVPILDNTRLILTPDRNWASQAEAGLAIGGVGDLWTAAQDYSSALGGLPKDMPRLLLSHNPDVAEEDKFLKGGQRVDCMISGHTHGGQIQVPFMGTPVVPSKFGQKYASGLVQGPICPVFIGRGIGLSVLPLRMGVTPEIAVLELRAS